MAEKGQAYTAKFHFAFNIIIDGLLNFLRDAFLK